MEYFIYEINHTYTDEISTSTKLLGFCDGIEGIEKIKKEALKLSGFKNYPEDFVIDKYQMDKIHWQHGFTSVIGEMGRDYLTEGDMIDKKYRSVKELGLESVFSVSHSYTIHRYLDDERFIGFFLQEKRLNRQ